MTTRLTGIDVAYDFYGERRELINGDLGLGTWDLGQDAESSTDMSADAASSVGSRTIRMWPDTDFQVATCSADQKIKLFRRGVEGTWDLEAEWKVRRRFTVVILISKQTQMGG